MLRRLVVPAVFLFLATTAAAGILPGFRTTPLGHVPDGGFVTSLAVDSRGILYYTTKQGAIYRLDRGESTLLGSVSTDPFGNSGLLGMALIDDFTAVVHYTRPYQTYDVVSRIDLATGAETIVHQFACDIDAPGRATSSEHHGGNPTVAPDGSIFVGIGDFGGYDIALKPEWHGGKIYRIHPDGRITQFAMGVRNPFDLAWDDARQRLVFTDNGEGAEDEINVIEEGANCGWPRTSGNRQPLEGAVAPVYVFPSIVAPTGMAALNDRNPMLRGGYLIGSFVTKALYYVADIDDPQPVPIVEKNASWIIDVAQAPGGEIYFATHNAIYRLEVPLPGDCNGDARVDQTDLQALERELLDGPQQLAIEAFAGANRGSCGCDATGDGLITALDRDALLLMLRKRTRAVRF